MTTQLLHCRRAITPTAEIAAAGILIRDGVIEAIGPREALTLPTGAAEISATDKTAIPGFVDVHIHGAGGHDVMEATPEAMRAVARTVATHGTTSMVATTVTASSAEILQSVAGIANYICGQRDDGVARAEVLGIHFEGPFLSPVRRGVHPAEWLRLPSADLLKQFLQAADGKTLILTIAPELLGAIPCIDAARKAGVVVALGHTDATYEQARAAMAHGAQHAVHVYNAMRPFSHRGTGVIGAVLTSSKVSAELIADGVHVDEAAMRMLLELKTPERVILVSDGMSATGMPDGKYQLGMFEVKVSGGVARNAEGKLAGSTLTLDRALRNMVALGVPLSSALRMMTSNPARQIGLEARKGVLAPGADADLVFLDDNLEVSGVMTRGAGLAFA